MSPVARNKAAAYLRPGQRAKHDLDLVRAIRSGSVESWHTFVDRYSGLIFSVLRQQLFAEDYDEIQTVYVDILKDFYDNKLQEFKGKASLATWLVLVARGKSVDYLRKKRGRRQLPRGYDKLNDFDRKIFQLHFVEGLGFEAVLQTVNGDGGGHGVEDIAVSVNRIITYVDRRQIKRLEYENDARRHGIKTGELLEYLYRAEAEVKGQGASRTPEQILQDDEHRQKIALLNSLKSRLSPEDRKLLALRFDRGLSARQISEELDMGGQRRVYTAIDRAIRRLRRLFAREDPYSQTDSEDYSAEIRR